MFWGAIFTFIAQVSVFSELGESLILRGGAYKNNFWHHKEASPGPVFHIHDLMWKPDATRVGGILSHLCMKRTIPGRRSPSLLTSAWPQNPLYCNGSSLKLAIISGRSHSCAFISPGTIRPSERDNGQRELHLGRVLDCLYSISDGSISHYLRTRSFSAHLSSPLKPPAGHPNKLREKVWPERRRKAADWAWCCWDFSAVRPPPEVQTITLTGPWIVAERQCKEWSLKVKQFNLFLSSTMKDGEQYHFQLIKSAWKLPELQVDMKWYCSSISVQIP